MAGRRRILLVSAAVCAGALLLARPGGGGEETAPAPEPTGQRPPPAAAPAVPPAPPAAAPSGSGTAPAAPASSPPVPEPPHDHSGVTEQETLDPAAAGAAVAAAERFAELWATPAPDWHDQLATLATAGLAGALAGADPPQPAPEITGAGTLLYEAPAWARVGVPARQGTVVLDVLLVEDGWLVSAVDWWPA